MNPQTPSYSKCWSHSQVSGKTIALKDGLPRKLIISVISWHSFQFLSKFRDFVEHDVTIVSFCVFLCVLLKSY
jgi:hypothetical protein